MKTIRVDQDLKRLLNATATPGDDRPQLENIMIKDTTAYATDGHMLVCLPVTVEDEDTNGTCYIKNDILKSMKLNSDLDIIQVNEDTLTRVDKTGKVTFDYEDIHYPDVDRVIKDADSNKIEITVSFNKGVLEKLLKCFDKEDDLLFEISAGNLPVKVSARGIKALIMPA